MKRALLTLSIVAVASSAAVAGVSKDDLKKLIAAGVSDDVITAFIKANGGVDPLSADDVVELKKAGASDKLLQAVLAPKADPAPATQPYAPSQPRPSAPSYAQPVQRDTVYVDRPIYVERPSTSYYVYDYPTTTYSYPTYAVYPSTTTYCWRHRAHHHCTTHTSYPSYSYAYYPRSSYYSGCAPTYGVYYGHHHGRRSSWSIGIGW